MIAPGDSARIHLTRTIFLWYIYFYLFVTQTASKS
jgi:hypothetical protein